MRWLHLSDLHLGRKESASQASALRELVGAASALLIDRPVDAIFITGDLANAGLEDQYRSFAELVLRPIRALPSCNSALVFAVPGNHDMDLDASAPMTWPGIGADQQRLFFEESPQGQKIRRHRAQSFAGFVAHCNLEGIIGPNPLEVVTRVYEFTAPTSALRMRVALTTTCFFSNAAKDLTDQGKAPAPTESVRQRLQESPQPDFTIVLGHHPVHWYRPQDHGPFYAMLDSRGALYLHGHTHNVEAYFGESGIQSLGFGAAYQAPLGSQSRNEYKNCFALCELQKETAALDVAVISWDANAGRWIPANDLPHHFKNASPCLRHGFRFKLDRTPQRFLFSPTPPRRERTSPTITEVIPIDLLSVEDWERLVRRLDVLDPPANRDDEITPIPGFPVQFLRKQGIERDLVRCLAGTGHVLSKAEIEAASLSLDYESYRSVVILSFGTIADDAKTSYLRLSNAKALRVFEGSDIASRLLRELGEGASEQLERLDAGRDSVSLLLSHDTLYLLLADRRSATTFTILDPSGSALADGHPAVLAARRLKPGLEKAQYRATHDAVNQPPSATPPFDRRAYVAACNREFSSARYTALAAVGIRLPDLPLDELYVEATADVGPQAAVVSSLLRAIDDMLQGIELEGPLRSELEAQLRRRLGVTPLSECGAARKLYQQHGSVVILGDPGSGKTCFAKYEILEYCRRDNNDHSWYGKHVPLYVPLAEVARHFNPGADLIEVACALAARRGLPITFAAARELASLGQLALFFDGLDEVVSIDQRAALVEAIGLLLSHLGPLGNRFVLTSRPAAIQLVTLPEELTTLYLRGLTEDEMRVLATRVLAARVSEHGDAVHLNTAKLTEGDYAVINRLIADVQAVPGIKRLATNPLLLTLLIMIYVNSGSPSAKRHRVYHQAVQTLVSVRSRAAGQRPLSEADLRARLGAVALSVFRDPDGAIPTRKAVHDCIRSVMKQHDSGVTDTDVSEFIQSVADSTGLLVLHDGSDHSTDVSTVTFMHYSFLEYYAAQGLKSLPVHEIADLGVQPRWREVVTLVAGLVSDEGDVSPLIEELLVAKSSADAITLDRILFAFDCALESEVPPDRAQRALFRALDDALRNGAAKYDSELRKEIGQRLARLASATSAEHIARFLITGFDTGDAQTVAAFIEVLGRAAPDMDVSAPVLKAFNETCKSKDTDIQVAVCDAAGRAAPLRTEAAESVIDEAIEGNLTNRLAAVRAIESAPALAERRWTRLVSCLRDDRSFIAITAARALLGAGLHVEPGKPEDRRLLLDVLRMLQQDGEGMKTIRMSATRREIDIGFHSEEQEDRLIAIRMLPWLKGEEQYVHDTLMSVLRRREPEHREECVAALQALPLATGAHRLMRVAEVDDLRSFLQSQTRDLRIASSRALGVVGRSPATVAQVGTDLAEYVRTHDFGEEFRWGIRGVAACADGWAEGRELMFSEIARRLAKGDATSALPAVDLVEVLRACQHLDGGATDSVAVRLMAAVRDYKVVTTVRQESCKTLAAVCVPSHRIATFFVEELQSRNIHLGDAVAESTRRFVERCRRSIDFVRAISGNLEALESAVIQHYGRARAELGTRGDVRVSELRRALEEIQQTNRSHREFAQIRTL
jgi:predicted phosphodiesterase